MLYDIGIIGAGPGGYVAAIRAAQLGAKVALIEKKALGGTCLNLGCIPTKSMLASVSCCEQFRHAEEYGIKVDSFQLDYISVLERQKKTVSTVKDGLLKLIQSYKNIDIISGEAKILASDSLSIDGTIVEVKHLIIASGSIPGELPHLKRDGQYIINSDDSVSLENLPSSLVIIGGGAIGVEWARIYSAFGLDVTLIEFMDRLLPNCDKDVSATVLRYLKKSNVKVLLKTSVDSVEKAGSILKLSLSNQETLEAEKIMLAVGRRPNLEIDGLDKLQLDLNGRFISVNSSMQTSDPNVYAIGDVVKTPQLAHVASHEAMVAVESVLNKEVKPIDYSLIPFCVYGTPEVAVVGTTEDQLKAEGKEFQTSKFFYAGNGKAIADAKTDGFIKILYDNSRRLLGVTIVGASASDIIHQGLIALKNKMTVDDFRDIVFAHPTLSETFLEAVIGLHVPAKALR